MWPFKDYQSFGASLKRRKLRISDGEMPTQAAVPSGVAIKAQRECGRQSAPLNAG